MKTSAFLFLAVALIIAGCGRPGEVPPVEETKPASQGDIFQNGSDGGRTLEEVKRRSRPFFDHRMDEEQYI